MTSHTSLQTPVKRFSVIPNVSHSHEKQQPHRQDPRKPNRRPFATLSPRMLTLVHSDSAAAVPASSLTERIQAFISGNLRNRTTLKELARFLGYSEKYSSEFFQLQMGTSFSQYLKQLRITKAKHMLSGNAASVTHVAEALGFSDSFAFSHFFKRAVGCSPTAFRKQRSVYGF
jgi:AraC-like DNA-binding protein